MQVPIMENPANAYLYNSEELEYEQNPKPGLPKEYAKMGFKKGWEEYKAMKNPKRKRGRKKARRKKTTYRRNIPKKSKTPKRSKTTKPKIKYRTRTKTVYKPVVKYRTRTNTVYKKNPRKIKRRKTQKKRTKRRIKFSKNPAVNFKKSVGILRPAGLKLYQQKPMKHVGITLLGIVDVSVIGLGLDFGLKKVKQLEGGYKRDIVRIISKLLIGTIISWGIAKATKKPEFGRLHQTGVYVAVVLDVIGTVLKGLVRKKIIAKLPTIPGLKGVELGFMMTPQDTFFEVFGFGEVRRAYLLGKVAKAMEAGHQIGFIRTPSYAGVRDMVTGELVVKGTHDGIANLAEYLFYETEGEIGEDISVEEGFQLRK